MSAETAFEVGRLYQPIKAISDILASSQKDIFIGLPGVQGYYPMSVVSNSGAAINHSGAGSPLIETGVVPVGYDGNAYRQLGNGTNFLAATGVYDLTGLETYIDTSIRGFTVGGWFMIDVSPVVPAGLISRSGPSPQIGYELRITGSNLPRFNVSLAGTSRVSVDGAAIALSEWYFFAGRFVPGTEIAVFTNGTKVVNVTAIPASQFVSSQAFEVGRYDADNAKIITAKCRDVFICRVALSDAQIETIRTATSP